MDSLHHNERLWLLLRYQLLLAATKLHPNAVVWLNETTLYLRFTAYFRARSVVQRERTPEEVVMLRDRVAPALMYTLKQTQRERFHLENTLEVLFVGITEQIFEDYKMMMRQAGADAYDLPFNDVIHDFWPFLNALVERQFPVSSSSLSKRLEGPGSESEEAVSDDQTAVVPSGVSTRRSNRSRTLTAKAREAFSNASISSLQTESAEEMPVAKDSHEEIYVSLNNPVQARFTLNLTGEQDEYVQLDIIPKHRPNDTTKEDATYIQPDIGAHVVPGPVTGKPWVRMDQDRWSWKRDEDVWTFKACFRSFRVDNDYYQARNHYPSNHDTPVDPNNREWRRWYNKYLRTIDRRCNSGYEPRNRRVP